MGVYVSTTFSDDYVATITLDHTEAYISLNREFIAELQQELTKILARKRMRGVVICSAKRDFLVGTDIRELHKLATAAQASAFAQSFSEVFEQIASFPIPVVAAISGFCLGSGLDLALACHARLVSTDPRTKMGFPEISLGIIPGSGGILRLPKLMGFKKAVELILSAELLNAESAVSLGIASYAVPQPLLHQEAQRLAYRGLKPTYLSFNAVREEKKSLWLNEANPISRALVISRAQDALAQQTHGFYPAPYRALEAFRKMSIASEAQSRAFQAKLFGELLMTRQSQGLMHIFHAEAALRRKYRSWGVSDSTKPAILAFAGLKATTSAWVSRAACADFPIYLSDSDWSANGQTLAAVAQYLAHTSLSQTEIQRRIVQVVAGDNHRGFHKAQFVFVDVAKKDQSNELRALENSCSEKSILLLELNGSSLLSLRESFDNPRRCIGINLLRPLEQCSFVELTPFDEGDDDPHLKSTLELLTLLGVSAIRTQGSGGSFTPRLLSALVVEARHLQNEGATVGLIDTALMQFGFRYTISSLRASYGEEQISQLLCQIPSLQAAQEERPQFSQQDPLAYDEIVERCLMALIKEAMLALAEGVIADPLDGDLAAVKILGFPDFWGGPFKYIDFIGANHIYEILTKLDQRYGSSFKPPSLLLHMKDRNSKFFSNEPSRYMP